MVQSLVEQLQLGAVDSSSPITDLLRKAKLAAVKLNAADFAAWVDLEINGYYNQTPVPAYRRVSGNLMYFNPFRGWQPIFGADGLQRSVFQPVGELFDLSKTQSGFLTIGVREELRRRISGNVGFQCDVRFHIGTTEIVGIVEAVRNNVLEWTLKLEKAGIRGEGLSFSSEETRVAHSMFVTNNYHGPIASIAQGSSSIQSVSQSNCSATPQEIAKAVGALIEAIKAAPIGTATDEALEELGDAEPELKSGRVPFGKIAKGFELLTKAEDIGLRAPEVVSRLHQLGQMLGLI